MPIHLNKLRKSVRVVNRILEELCLQQHPDVTLIGRSARGLNFLGRRKHPVLITGIQPGLSARRQGILLLTRSQAKSSNRVFGFLSTLSPHISELGAAFRRIGEKDSEDTARQKLQLADTLRWLRIIRKSRREERPLSVTRSPIGSENAPICGRIKADLRAQDEPS